jgi:hypothetical protein
MLDNSALIAPFCPAQPDGDTFIYTEMLDRGKRKGNNGHRLVKTFYHRSVDEFWSQWPTLKALCDLARVRACTRLAPRSYAKVGAQFTRLVVDASLTANWAGMKSLYNRACGIVSPNTNLWLWDIDERTETTEALAGHLRDFGVLRARIPSKRGEHLITTAFDARPLAGVRGDGTCPEWGAVQLHRDNPTNLYIPDGAE